MVRPTTDPKRRTLLIRVSERDLRMLSRLAVTWKCSRSEVVRRLVRAAAGNVAWRRRAAPSRSRVPGDRRHAHCAGPRETSAPSGPGAQDEEGDPTGRRQERQARAHPYGRAARAAHGPQRLLDAPGD